MTFEETGRTLFSGWGRTAPSAARPACPTSRDQVAELIADARRTGTPLLSRGLGRSYGDAAQCAGGIVLDCTGLDRIYELDAAAGTLRVDAGVSLEAILRCIVPEGWFVPVTPGTAQVTVGGAIAADVHGKNHHRDGSFANFVDRIVLVGADGERVVGPDEAADLYWSTTGAMGLTGVVVEAVLRLRPIASSSMLVDTARADDLDEAMAMLAETDRRHQYSVAWVDGVSRGRQFGRSVVHGGDHATFDDLSAAERRQPLAFRASRRGRIGVTPPVNLLRRETVVAFNELWFRTAPRRRAGELQRATAFFHPLDGLADWNRLFGPRGFTQYQFVVPFDAAHVVAHVLAYLQERHLAPTLCVLKRFGAANPGPLSFPIPGWTLTIDLPLAAPGVAAALDHLDDLVADAGGRVYLAKDGRLRPELLPVMYPRLDEWRKVVAELGAGEAFVSDLWRRLRPVA